MKPFGTKPVVLPPLFFIAEDGICFIDILKLFFGFWVFLVSVRVKLQGLFSKGFFYFLLGGVFADAKNFVIIAHFIQSIEIQYALM